MFPTKSGRFLFAALLLILPFHRASALLNFDGTRNQIFVFGNVSLGYNSNIFSDSTERGDSSVSGEVGTEYDRLAGALGVKATAKLGYQTFSKYTSENALNPNFSIELAKNEGRTTGSFSVRYYRESRSDSSVNLRTNSWNLPLDLKLRYLVSDRFYGTSETGYVRRTYNDDNPLLLDYHDFSEALDLFYIYTSKLDLVAGYRIRYSQVSAGPDTYDHWFNVGAVGSLAAKVNGQVRFGYEIRDISGGQSFNHYNALVALNWIVTRKLTVTGQLTRDFNTIATGASVDTLIAAVRANYSFTRKFEAEGGIAYGRNRFLGGTQSSRRDDFFSADLGAHYKINEHFTVGANYSYMKNWSTLNFSDFDRQGFSVDISSRF
jgi:hypothetical protein